MTFDRDKLAEWAQFKEATDPEFMKSYEHYNELWELINEKAKEIATEDPIALYIFGLSLHAFSENIMTQYFKASGMPREHVIFITDHIRSVSQLFAEQIMMQVEEK